jgi:SET domain-containing protein
MKWMPQPRLNAGGLTAFNQPVVGATATLICGRHGNWTRFIAGSDREANVATKQMAFSGSWRIAVYALRDIEFGEQIMIDYRRARRERGVVYMFQKALSNVDEEDEYQDSEFG